MIGAEPNTQWLNGRVSLDEKGFVRTGAAGQRLNARPMRQTCRESTLLGMSEAGQ
jgi:hypothetical protein